MRSHPLALRKRRQTPIKHARLVLCARLGLKATGFGLACTGFRPGKPQAKPGARKIRPGSGLALAWAMACFVREADARWAQAAVSTSGVSHLLYFFEILVYCPRGPSPMVGNRYSPMGHRMGTDSV